MDAGTMEKEILELQKKVTLLEDLEAIRRVQRSYGYYLEHWLSEDIVNLFADHPDTSLSISVGVFQGKEGVRRYFTDLDYIYGRSREVLHLIMQLSGIVDIAPDGLTATGRWYGFGIFALPLKEGVNEGLAAGIYTADYIKENGIWKIWHLMWNPAIMDNVDNGWVEPDRKIKPGSKVTLPPCRPDISRFVNTRYPSGYVPPFHYKHPVTGKPSTDLEHNREVTAQK